MNCKGPIYLGAIALIVGAGLAHGAVTECDYQAGHKDDPDKVVPGISGSQMDKPAAERACRAVLAEMPNHARTHYQLGRVLYYSGRAEEALRHLKIAADTGYRQAIFVLGYVQTIGEQQVPIDYCAAGELWLRSAALEHPWTGSFLVSEYLSGHFADCDIELSDPELQRLARLTTDHVPFSHSEGRIEAMLAQLEAHLKQQSPGEK